MQDLIVVATLTAKPGHEAVLKAALERIVPPSRAEEGCIRYDLHADLANPASFVMLEAWRDADALASHEATPHFKELLDAVGGLVEVQIVKLNQLL